LRVIAYEDLVGVGEPLEEIDCVWSGAVGGELCASLAAAFRRNVRVEGETLLFRIVVAREELGERRFFEVLGPQNGAVIRDADVARIIARQPSDGRRAGVRPVSCGSSRRSATPPAVAAPWVTASSGRPAIARRSATTGSRGRSPTRTVRSRV